MIPAANDARFYALFEVLIENICPLFLKHISGSVPFRRYFFPIFPLKDEFKTILVNSCSKNGMSVSARDIIITASL